MSGFAGIVSLDGAPPDERLLLRMAQTLAFRGPDGTHITTKPGAGFCFTFLRTGPAPQCPSQPCSLDGKIWLLGDVRLDGRNDLRRKLEQHGEPVSAGATDEELILRTWKKWGEEGIADLIGDYAFAIWDSEARSLRCWRDLMGARPFFYARVGNQLYFSNTLNSLRCASDVSNALDDHFIGDFLLQGWCSYPGRTAFRDISRLPAGYSLHVADTRVAIQRFTSVAIDEPLWLKREEEYVERFRALLEAAVAERLPAGPVAVFMSGGLDSTSVAAVAAHYARRNTLPLDLRAVTLDFRPLFDDPEARYASLAAKHIGIPIELVQSPSTLPFAALRHPTPEPCAEPYWSSSQQQCENIAKNTSVALTGNGGDVALTGQAWPYFMYLLRRAEFHALLSSFAGYILRHGRIPPLRGGFRTALRRMVRPPEPMAHYPRWLNSEFEERLCLRERWLETDEPVKGTHPLYPNAYSNLTRAIWPSLLETEDAAWSNTALESRAPLMDLRIFQFLLRVPPVPLCLDKELLRRAVRGFLPDQVRLRPKCPFGADQVALQIKSGSWRAVPLSAPNRAITQFVNWPALERALWHEPTAFPWPNLRPISLLYWLESV